MSAQATSSSATTTTAPTESKSTEFRHTLAQTLALSASIVVAYIWLSFPTFALYSLQAFAGCVLLYFILKKLNQAAIWELLPATAVDEMTLVTFAFLILIGNTGGTVSYFFALIFIYLFFVSMTMRFWTSIIITLETLLFFYALAPNLSSSLNLSHLISIPVVMTFFLFAKYQYDESKQKETLIKLDSDEINLYQKYVSQQTSQLVANEQTKQGIIQFFSSFLFDFMEKKLDLLLEMIDFPQNRNSIKGQLTLMRLEIEKIKTQLAQSIPPDAPTPAAPAMPADNQNPADDLVSTDQPSDQNVQHEQN